MGFLKSITKAIEKPFRTGASRAAKNAASSSQETANQYNEFIKLLKPSFNTGTSALKGLGEYTNPDALGDLYNSVSDSQLVTDMVADRQEYLGQNLAASGLRNSGRRLSAAAELPTDVITSIMDKIIGLKQNVASIGLGQGSSILGSIGGIQNANNAATSAAFQQAGNRASLISGLIGGGSQIGSALALGSDRRLKKNAEIIGKIGPLNVYSWEWAVGASDFMGRELTMTTGFMADEVQEVYPQHVYPIEIDGFEILTVDYDSLMKEEGMKDAA